jgi:Protein of unknown function (DUF3500)
MRYRVSAGTTVTLIAAAGTLSLVIFATDFGSVAPQAVAQTPAPHSDLPTTPDATDVVNAANAFLAMLSDQQRAVAQIELKAPLATKWSNFPDPIGQRNGNTNPVP